MPLSGKEMLKRYEEKGCLSLRQNGSHVIVAKGFFQRNNSDASRIEKGIGNDLSLQSTQRR